MGHRQRNCGLRSTEGLRFCYRLLQGTQNNKPKAGPRPPESRKRGATDDPDDPVRKKHAAVVTREIRPKGPLPAGGSGSLSLATPRPSTSKKEHRVPKSRMTDSHSPDDDPGPSFMDKHAMIESNAARSPRNRHDGDPMGTDMALPLHNFTPPDVTAPQAAWSLPGDNLSLETPSTVDIETYIAPRKLAKVKFQDVNKHLHEFTVVFDPKSERSFATRRMIEQLRLQRTPWKPGDHHYSKTMAGLQQVKRWVWVKIQAPHIGLPALHPLKVAVLNGEFFADFCFGKRAIENMVALYPDFKEALVDLCGDLRHELDTPLDESQDDAASQDVHIDVVPKSRCAKEPECPKINPADKSRRGPAPMSPSLSQTTRSEAALASQAMTGQLGAFGGLPPLHIPMNNIVNSNSNINNTLLPLDWTGLNIPPVPGPTNPLYGTGQYFGMGFEEHLLADNFLSPTMDTMDFHQHMPPVSVGYDQMTAYISSFYNPTSALFQNWQPETELQDEE